MLIVDTKVKNILVVYEGPGGLHFSCFGRSKKSYEPLVYINESKNFNSIDVVSHLSLKLSENSSVAKD